jgi:hypothetical protein
MSRLEAVPGNATSTRARLGDGTDPSWRRLTLRVYRGCRAQEVGPERKWLIRSGFAAEARNLLVLAWVHEQVQRRRCERTTWGTT